MAESREERALGANGPPPAVDLFLFMGQSNMAGRGVSDAAHPQTAPALLPGAGYEYRAVSAPDCLYPIAEPFGYAEDRPGGIDDLGMKTGSMATAFANAYFLGTGVPIVGISASKGGSRISQWQPGGAYLSDTITRLKSAEAFLQRSGCLIRRRCMLWCQGESDGDAGTGRAEYVRSFVRMEEAMRREGVELCFLVRIGHYNGGEAVDYGEIQAAQEQLARERPGVVMVSRGFSGMKARGWMKDMFHYYQAAYNEIGTEAGRNAAKTVCPVV